MLDFQCSTSTFFLNCALIIEYFFFTYRLIINESTQLHCHYYFSFANASLILAHALSIFFALLANEKRTQTGSPNASPITEDTCAVFNKYIEKSAEFLIVV